MHRIIHRVNTVKALSRVPKEFGVEVDIRSEGKRLIMHHDPFEEGESFTDWLNYFNHGTLILNVKEEGLERVLIDLMESKKIRNFFFLDQSFPFLIKTANSGERRCAIRISEFESINTVMSLADKVDWVWVDCFSKFPLSKEDATRLQQEGNFKLCFVSPELQGRTDISEVKEFRSQIDLQEIKGEAVCTKYPDLWA